VQGADDVGACVAAALEHHGLAVAAHVGDQLDALRGAHEGPAFAFLGQRQVVAHLGHGQFVPQVAGRLLEDECLFAPEQFLVKVAGDR
jgi:hypothetical protein